MASFVLGTCVIHIRRNSVHGHPKFFVVKWLGLSVTVSVRARDRDQSDKHICLAFIAWSDKEPWQKGLISACVQLRHFVTTSDWGSALAGRAALSAASGLRPDGLTDCVDRLSIIIALLT